MELFGDCLKRILNSHESKPTNLAKELLIDVSLVRRWLRNERVPDLSSPYRSRIGDYFQLSEEERTELENAQVASLKRRAERKKQSTKSSREKLIRKQPTIQLHKPPLHNPIHDPAIPLRPSTTQELVGRGTLIMEMKQRLLNGNSLALHGFPGVGKTALSTSLAHDPEIREQFQDGILWVNLGEKANPLHGLSKWGALLGLEMDKLGSNPQAWREALLALIDTRRMLLVIDDAWKVDDALAFQIPGPNCVHLLTTRFPEVALSFAQSNVIQVDELSEEDGLLLLHQFIPEVVERRLEKAQELIREVGSLPLAITILGSYLRHQAYKNQPRRLESALNDVLQPRKRLSIEQPDSNRKRQQSLNASIGISDQALNNKVRDALRSLSVFPPKPSTFSEEAALALSPITTLDIDTLVDFGLLESRGNDRYTLHKTIYDYARANVTDTFAYKEMILYFSSYLQKHKKDYGMLDPEIDNIRTALQIAFDLEMKDVLVSAANAFYHFLETRGLYSDAQLYLERAEIAARSSGDSIGLATTLCNLGTIVQRYSRYQQAEKYYQEGLRLARLSGDSERTCEILINLGTVVAHRRDFNQAQAYFLEGYEIAIHSGYSQLVSQVLSNMGKLSGILGDYIQAKQYLLEGLKVARQTGEKERICILLTNLGAVSADYGDYKLAEQSYQEGLAIARQIQRRSTMSLLLSNLGSLANACKNYLQAKNYLEEGLDIARKIKQPERISLLLSNLGGAMTNLGEFEQAKKYLQESLDTAKQAESYWLISISHIEWGELLFKQEQFDESSLHFQDALSNAEKVSSKELIAEAQYGLARIANMQGNKEQAYSLGKSSLAIFKAINHNKLREVEQWFNSLSFTESDGVGSNISH